MRDVASSGRQTQGLDRQIAHRPQHGVGARAYDADRIRSVAGDGVRASRRIGDCRTCRIAGPAELAEHVGEQRPLAPVKVVAPGRVEPDPVGSIGRHQRRVAVHPAGESLQRRQISCGLRLIGNKRGYPRLGLR